MIAFLYNDWLRKALAGEEGIETKLYEQLCVSQSEVFLCCLTKFCVDTLCWIDYYIVMNDDIRQKVVDLRDKVLLLLEFISKLVVFAKKEFSKQEKKSNSNDDIEIEHAQVVNMGFEPRNLMIVVVVMDMIAIVKIIVMIIKVTVKVARN